MFRRQPIPNPAKDAIVIPPPALSDRIVTEKLPKYHCFELFSLLVFSPCCIESLPSWRSVCSPSLRVCVRTGLLLTIIHLAREPPPMPPQTTFGWARAHI